MINLELKLFYKLYQTGPKYRLARHLAASMSDKTFTYLFSLILYNYIGKTHKGHLRQFS
jgi:hypothetical protein